MSFNTGDFRNEVQNFIDMQNSRTQMAESIITVLATHYDAEKYLVAFLNKEMSAGDLREALLSKGSLHDEAYSALFFFFINFIDMKNSNSKSLPAIIKDAGKAIMEEQYDYSK